MHALGFFLLVLLTLVTDRIDQNSNDVYNSYGFILLLKSGTVLYQGICLTTR